MANITMDCKRFRELFPYLVSKKRGEKRLSFDGMRQKFIKNQQEIAATLIKIGFEVFKKYKNDKREYQMLDVTGYTASMQPLYKVESAIIIHWMATWQ